MQSTLSVPIISHDLNHIFKVGKLVINIATGQYVLLAQNENFRF